MQDDGTMLFRISERGCMVGGVIGLFGRIIQGEASSVQPGVFVLVWMGAAFAGDHFLPGKII
jgi:hypothetical protein